MRHCKLLCLLLLQQLSFTASAQLAGGKTYAVVVGVSSYEQQIPKLLYADKDAALFAAYLQAPAGGALPDAQVKLLLNDAATIAAVYQALDWLKANCTEKDLACFYFSGHGDVETKDSSTRGYLLAYNSPPTNYRNNAIRVEDLNDCANHLSLVNKCRVLLITDACHSGKLAGDFYKGRELVASELQTVLNNEVRLAACAVDEKAAEGSDWGGGRGVFSYYLLEGLQGKADAQQDRQVQLGEIGAYLQRSLAADAALRRDEHRQTPITDGNPNFILATLNNNTVVTRDSIVTEATQTSGSQLGRLKKIGFQPIDHFFSLAGKRALEQVIDFEELLNLPADSAMLHMVQACIDYQRSLDKGSDSLDQPGEDYEYYHFANYDSLGLLLRQLRRDPSVQAAFQERFVQLAHTVSQAMVNAYLGGDVAELEKRQYYHAGNRNYRSLLPMVQLARRLIPAQHYLSRVFEVQQQYVSGLIERLALSIDLPQEKLHVKNAFRAQFEALRLEPYAAYIHNELGNLYVYTKRFDSAAWHFKRATLLTPTWAIPWSNMARLGLATKNLNAAKRAVFIADSLQPGLSFVLMNAGLVMDMAKDRLAAESYYERAIAANNVHFLPYQRLGEGYIATGNYARADRMLAAAALRKDRFTVNDRSLAFGVELGGHAYNPIPAGGDTCTTSREITGDKEPGRQLLNLLLDMERRPQQAATLVPHLERLAATHPSLPYVHHYIGKYYFYAGQWTAAVGHLRKERMGVKTPDLFRPFFTSIDSCTTLLIEHFAYDEREDAALLGAAYEKQDSLAAAMTAYESLITIENRLQEQQANLYGFEESLEKAINTNGQNKPMAVLLEPLIVQYEQVIPMVGYLLAAAVAERSGALEKAETYFLEQVAQNRRAGNLRQAQANAGPFQMASRIKTNYYWLFVNRTAEAATRAFYQRMVSQFPRDHRWQQKAGLFLYQRLRLSFKKIPVAEAPAFYRYLLEHAYPFLSSVEVAEPDSIRVAVPGRGDSLQVDFPVYDPLTEARTALELAIKLSGDKLPAPALLIALADLHRWVGEHDIARQYYRKAFELPLVDHELRHDLVYYYVALHDLQEAKLHLLALTASNTITPAEKLLLASYHILEGNAAAATKILQKTIARPETEERSQHLYAQLFLLSGKPGGAVPYLTDLVRKAPVKEVNNYGDIQQVSMLPDLYYSLARAFALQKKNKESRQYLVQALDSGFVYRYVLDNDPAWKRIRGTVSWTQLLEKYSFPLDYTEKIPDIGLEPVQYRIP